MVSEVSNICLWPICACSINVSPGTIAAAGSVAGLSGAGITPGLAAIGSVVV